MHHAIQRTPGKCIFCVFRNSQYGASSSLRVRARARASASAKYTLRLSSSSSFSPQEHFSPPSLIEPSFATQKKRKNNGEPNSSSTKEEKPFNLSEINPSATSFNKAGYLQLVDPLQHIRRCILRVEQALNRPASLHRLGLTAEGLRKKISNFEKQLLVPSEQDAKSRKLLQRLTKVSNNKSHGVLLVELRTAFQGWLLQATQGATHSPAMPDLQYPPEWFPATRGVQRELHLHVGPTNSGKTYHALKRLEQAKSGVYAGPLRLLAHEVYTRLNAQGIRCNLVTGDDRRTADNNPVAPLTSCTVEMIPLNSTVDVAVIDEIQMLGSSDRGWAWTQAVLGMKAKELHMCGEERAVPIVQQLAALCGEKLHIHRYERLTPLVTMPASLGGDLKCLRKGDCVVAFSIASIHALRQAIEKSLGVRCAVIYGTLPAETRAQQANLFNDPNNDYDILVASNAVGMGLNLSIKRMIFQTSQIYRQGRTGPLPVADVKQIAGRAGRYSSVSQDLKKGSELGSAKTKEALDAGKTVGWVTTLEKIDHDYVATAMMTEPEPILTAGIFPPAVMIEKLSKRYPPEMPLAFLLAQLEEHAKTNSFFHICDLEENIMIADALHSVRNLTILERLIICAAPMDMEKTGEGDLLREYARLIAHHKSATILDIQRLELELLDFNGPYSKEFLRKLEGLHKGITSFLWLSYRFKATFVDQGLAMHARDLVQAKIQEVLAKMSFNYEEIREMQKQNLRKTIQIQQHAGDDAGGGGGGSGDDVTVIKTSAYPSSSSVPSEGDSSVETIENAEPAVPAPFSAAVERDLSLERGEFEDEELLPPVEEDVSSVLDSEHDENQNHDDVEQSDLQPLRESN